VVDFSNVPLLEKVVFAAVVVASISFSLHVVEVFDGLAVVARRPGAPWPSLSGFGILDLAVVVISDPTLIGTGVVAGVRAGVGANVGAGVGAGFGGAYVGRI
jgi:hypothetical protein